MELVPFDHIGFYPFDCGGAGSLVPLAHVVLRRGRRLVHWYTGFQAHQEDPLPKGCLILQGLSEVKLRF